jgi:2,4-dienoyl-CoA reductase-like NADH-dependent reductase (Old Yellow Enzyme family)
MDAPDVRELFSPGQLGPSTLQHRVLMNPLTRSGSVQPADVPGNFMLEDSAQRASEGAFIISKVTQFRLRPAFGMVRRHVFGGAGRGRR